MVSQQPAFAVILVAAGSGQRMGGGPTGPSKVWLDLGGKPVVSWSLDTVLAMPECTRVVVVHREADRQSALQVTENDARIDLVAGGSERTDSVWNGLQALAQYEPETVAIHDAARPFVTPEMFAAGCRAAHAVGAATVACPLSDTLKREEAGLLVETLPRESLYRVQTPQVFRYKVILEAHRAYRKDPVAGVTDDCMLVENQGYAVALVQGAESNLKITTPVDLAVAQALIAEGHVPIA